MRQIVNAQVITVQEQARLLELLVYALIPAVSRNDRLEFRPLLCQFGDSLVIAGRTGELVLDFLEPIVNSRQSLEHPVHTQ